MLDGSPNESETQKDEVSEKEEKTEEEIKHIAGTLNAEDLYALPNKRKNDIGEIAPEDDVNDDEDDEKEKQEDIEGIEDKDETKDLPPGWEKHEGLSI